MIETKNLILRRVSEQDVEDIFEYAQDEDTGPRAGWPPHKTIEDTKKIVGMWLDEKSEEEILALVYKPDNKVVGTAGIVLLNNHFKDEKNIFAKKMIEEGKIVYEIGTTIGKQYWNKGIASESLNAIVDFLFEKRNADVVLTLHYDANVGSKRVQEKNNMKIFGQYERDKKWFNTECTTMVVRGKTREDWLTENKNITL